MAIRSTTVRDDFATTTTNTASGGLAIFEGAFAIDRFDPRAGVLLDVTYRLDITVAATGGIINDGSTQFGSAEARYGVDLDPDDNDADAIDAFVQLPPNSGLPAVPLLPGAGVNTPVFFRVSATTGRQDAGDPANFVGGGAIRFGYEAGSGVLASGGAGLGSQGNSFTSVNTGKLSVSYEFRAAIAGDGQRDALTGTRDTDVLLGRGGADRLAGREGSDLLFGDDGRDRLDGGRDGDRLFGGNGDDRLSGGKGGDILRGSNGADTFVLAGGRGRDRIDDWGGRDRLDLRSLDVGRGDIRLVEAGDDLRVIAEGDLVAVLIDAARAEVGSGDILL